MTGRKRILVLNPNSNESVTAGLRKSLEYPVSDVLVECATLAEGPFGIETDADIDFVAPIVADRIQKARNFDAFVIACYSDPGLAQARQLVTKPVFGMQESALRVAVSYGGQFGVLALSELSIRRHLRYIKALGYTDRLAAELPLDISVDDAANDPGTVHKVILAGERLVTEYSVSALILGCAGMAAIKAAAEKKLPVPVIEPAQAALQLAIEAL